MNTYFNDQRYVLPTKLTKSTRYNDNFENILFKHKLFQFKINEIKQIKLNEDEHMSK